jgi:hypothetical protein
MAGGAAGDRSSAIRSGITGNDLCATLRKAAEKGITSSPTPQQ